MTKLTTHYGYKWAHSRVNELYQAHARATDIIEKILPITRSTAIEYLRFNPLAWSRLRVIIKETELTINNAEQKNWLTQREWNSLSHRLNDLWHNRKQLLLTDPSGPFSLQ